MSEQERVDKGIDINNDLELEGYRTYTKLQICMTIIGGIVSLGLIASVTFLTWHFNKPVLTWFLVLPAINYMFG